jgi:hypothetical protein
MLKQRNLKYGNRVFVVSYADITPLGATLTGAINLPLILPAGAVVDLVLQVPTVQFAAPSLSALSSRVISAQHNYGTAFNIFQAPGPEVFDADQVRFREKLGSTTQMQVTFVAVGANLGTLTAGELQIVINYSGSNVVAAGGQFL